MTHASGWRLSVAGVLLALCHVPAVMADGRVVDKVYHPYVQPLEREFEYRYVYQRQPNHPNDNDIAQQVGYGFTLTDTTAMALYLIGERTPDEKYQLTGYEAEVRWMLTEQGQLSWDYGMLFELERADEERNYEFTTGLLMEKEFPVTSLAINALLVHEWGETVDTEWEAEFRLQYRYRYLPWLQPSLEVYSGEDYNGMGPGFMGVHKFTPMRQLKWEAAWVFPLDSETINNTARFALRYEF
jgi:hypothetical protein